MLARSRQLARHTRLASLASTQGRNSLLASLSTPSSGSMKTADVPRRAMTMVQPGPNHDNRPKAYSVYNDQPGTGKTGMYEIPPNNYPFYSEEEK